MQFSLLSVMYGIGAICSSFKVYLLFSNSYPVLTHFRWLETFCLVLRNPDLLEKQEGKTAVIEGVLGNIW